MNIIIGLLLVIFVIVAILLVLLILVQDDGTDGAGILFGSSASQQYGARKGNIITRTTSILATIFMVVAFGLSFLFQLQDKEANLDIIGEENQTTKIEWWNADANDEEEIPLDSEENFKNNIDASEEPTLSPDDSEELPVDTSTPSVEEQSSSQSEPTSSISDNETEKEGVSSSQ